MSDAADDGCGFVCTVVGCSGLYSVVTTITFDFGGGPDDEMSRQENVPDGCGDRRPSLGGWNGSFDSGPRSKPFERSSRMTRGEPLLEENEERSP